MWQLWAAANFATGFVPLLHPCADIATAIATQDPWLALQGSFFAGVDIVTFGTGSSVKATATLVAKAATTASQAVRAGKKGAQLVTAAKVAKSAKDTAWWWDIGGKIKNVAKGTKRAVESAMQEKDK